MRLKKLFIGVLGLGTTAYVLATLVLYFLQSKLIFIPSQVIETTPATFKLPYQEIWLPVKNSRGEVEKMHGWWLPSSQPNAKVLLYLHGNGLNIGANVAHANRFHKLGFSVLLMDYRGYGRSEGGFPTEASVYEDAATMWDYLVNQQRISPQNIFIYGHSLGGAIAVDLAAKHPNAAALIVESSFASIRKMVDYQPQYRFFPIDLILRNKFDSVTKVRSLKMPVLFFHGTVDTTIPYQMSEQLFAAAPEPKRLLLIPKAGHSNLADIAGKTYLQAVQKLIEQADYKSLN
ncbi:alpha/beta hydrolase [Merismopedia glauca]|uniref:Phospholipase n=1 Tax=Merismopedia glauca CCAP 1448/3 TaxID=1296344 RepID=A0A2T1C992_9CYAN|nr:alpha/beta fold hydrolase [Merismopedia glauca]PSB04826.1 phospholipase [Merismopedia glauca CCAP 1448/3]